MGQELYVWSCGFCSVFSLLHNHKSADCKHQKVTDCWICTGAVQLTAEKISMKILLLLLLLETELEWGTKQNKKEIIN